MQLANPGKKAPSPQRTSQSPTASRTAPRSPSAPPIFFFEPNEENGIFCQWYPSTFTVSKEDISRLVGHTIDPEDPWTPIYFNCAEHFMMYCKAGRFHDAATQKKVLATKDTKEQKRLARLTEGFDAASWDVIKSQVVVAGNIAEFGQNPELKTILLGTGDRLLAKAAVKDRVWGDWIFCQGCHDSPDQTHMGIEQAWEGTDGGQNVFARPRGANYWVTMVRRAGVYFQSSDRCHPLARLLEELLVSA